MAQKATLIPVLRRLAVGLVVCVTLLSVILSIETYRFQHKAELLMEDFQSINLRHSSWDDAERLIRRWGKYGSYQGDCTGSFCRYTIVLVSPQRRLESRSFFRSNNRFIQAAAEIFFAACQHLGSKSATLRTSIVIRDNLIMRKGAVFEYEVPFAFSHNHVYSLIATSRAASRLTVDGWPLIESEQLAEHPFYVVAVPGGCTFCKMVNVTFTPDAPNPEVRRLTTFDFGCLTRLVSCRYLGEIYPASEELHLDDDTATSRPVPSDQANGQGSALPVACRVPIFARGREADQVLSVTSVNEAQERKPGEVNEKASVRLESVLKGSTRYKTGEVFSVTDRSYSPYTPLQIETPLTPGKRFLLLSTHPEDKSDPLELDRCLVIPDTPEARTQIQQGVSQNDSLRYPDPHFSDFIPE